MINFKKKIAIQQLIVVAWIWMMVFILKAILFIIFEGKFGEKFPVKSIEEYVNLQQIFIFLFACFLTKLSLLVNGMLYKSKKEKNAEFQLIVRDEVGGALYHLGVILFICAALKQSLLFYMASPVILLIGYKIKHK